MFNPTPKIPTPRLVVFCLAGFLSGCAEPRTPEFEPNIVYAYATELEIEYSMQPALDEAQIALRESFGTPNEPKVPDFLDNNRTRLVNGDYLQAASGPAHDAGRGLYRKHCTICHGESGNGRGPNAAISDPYPRDFRMGKFKFKSTARGAKPLREDLRDTIQNGIAGTTMVRIPELTEDDIRALADYVIYLSWRGEVERELLREAADIDFEAEDSGELKNLYLPGSPHFDDKQLPLVRETIERIAESWVSADEFIKEIPDAGDVPIHATSEELRLAAMSSLDSPLKQSVERGRELFASESASCSKCHGALGYGDGQTQDYDDWTKDWTVRIHLNPEDDKALIPLLARGALPPKKILPRDFRDGVYRGGASPEEIFHRIAYGIDGTPMPAVEGVVSPEDIWHLVNYVRSLEEPEPAASE